MAAKRSPSSMDHQTEEFSPERSDEFETQGHVPTYVIQRSGELIREWWTGTGWSEDVNDALQYSGEPDVSREVFDESAIAVRVRDLD